MPLLCPVQTVKTLLPGLVALTSILVVIIAFLFEQYLLKKPELPYIKKPYIRLIKLMVFALIIAGITSILSLLYIIRFPSNLLYCSILFGFIIVIIIIIFGTSITAYTILAGEKKDAKK